MLLLSFFFFPYGVTIDMTEIHSFQPLLDNTTELTRFRGTYFLTEFESRIGDEQHYWKLALAYFGEFDQAFRSYPITFLSSFSSLPVLP